MIEEQLQMNESSDWKWIRAIEGGQASVLEVQDQEAGRKTGICALDVEVVFLGGVGDLSVGGAGACMHENGRGRLKRNDNDRQLLYCNEVYVVRAAVGRYCGNATREVFGIQLTK